MPAKFRSTCLANKSNITSVTYATEHKVISIIICYDRHQCLAAAILRACADDTHTHTHARATSRVRERNRGPPPSPEPEPSAPGRRSCVVRELADLDEAAPRCLRHRDDQVVGERLREQAAADGGAGAVVRPPAQLHLAGAAERRGPRHVDVVAQLVDELLQRRELVPTQQQHHDAALADHARAVRPHCVWEGTRSVTARYRNANRRDH